MREAGRVERWLVADLRDDAGRAPRAIQLKLDKLARDPFAFFRGTLPQYVRRVAPRCRGAMGEVVGVITGDLHLENLGTFPTPSGRLAFDLNDFDEVTLAPLVVDLRRLAASAQLALAPRAPRLAAAGAEAVLEGFARGLESDRVPEPRAVRDLRTRCERLDVVSFIRASLETAGRKARLPGSDPQAVAMLEEAARDLRQRTPAPLRQRASFYQLLDAAPRLAGNGSLGRRRYLALFAGPDPSRGQHALVDFKEPRPSPWGGARTLLGSRPRAEQVEQVARAFRAESERVLGTASVRGRLFQVREHSAFGTKISAAQLTPESLLEYASYCGAAIARAWRRAQQPVHALARALDSKGRSALLMEIASDCEQTQTDHAEFLAHRERIAATLGVNSAA